MNALRFVPLLALAGAVGCGPGGPLGDSTSPPSSASPAASATPSGVVGNAAVGAPRGQRNERWFVVWLGTAKDPIDTNAAITLANSIRQWTPPPPPPPPEAPAPDPNAPPPDPNAPPPPPGRAPVGVPVPVTTPVPEMMPPG